MADFPAVENGQISFKNRVVVVTGAARGVGAATVARFVARGWTVLAVDACLGDREPGAAQAIDAEIDDDDLERLKDLVSDAPVIRALGDEGVLAMVCDSTNVFVPGVAGSEGDVAVAIAAARNNNSIDIAMGIGGTPEGVITACALKCLDGEIQGMLAPQSDDCCCFERSTPISSLVRSFRPWRSV